MKSTQLLAAVFALSSLSAASWSDNLLGDLKIPRAIDGLLYGRQDDSSSSQPTATQKSESAQSTGDSKASSGAAASSSDSPKNTGSATESKGKSTVKATTGSAKSTGKATASNKSGGGNSTEFDPRLPAGGIQMMTPAATAGSQFYKIGDWVTLAWNYTSLSATPTAIDILATCSANQGTYTIAVNQSVEETGQVFWDTGAYQSTGTLPLLTETYTLLIYDADSSISATARAGYLGVYSQFQFGMYTPQPYTPWTDFKCATCNSAVSDHERSAFMVILLTGSITILSFLGFASSFGLW